MKVKEESKVELKFDSIDSLCRNLYLQLQRYDAVQQFIRYSIDHMDRGFLRELRERINMRLGELESVRLRSWDEESARIYLRKLSSDSKKILELILEYGSITKSRLMDKTGFSHMKIAGVLAGINNMAKAMERKPVITRTEIRVDGRLDFEYRIEESFLKAMKALSKK